MYLSPWIFIEIMYPALCGIKRDSKFSHILKLFESGTWFFLYIRVCIYNTAVRSSAWWNLDFQKKQKQKHDESPRRARDTKRKQTHTTRLSHIEGPMFGFGTRDTVRSGGCCCGWRGRGVVRAIWAFIWPLWREVVGMPSPQHAVI